MNKGKIRKLILIIMALAAFAGCAGSGKQESTGEYLDDAVITSRVKSAFVADKEVSATNIKVETVKGTVHLSGYAKTAMEADKAEAVARGIKGVKAVKNYILVK